MALTGLGFAAAWDFGFILVVAFAGTANPSAGSVSIFVPLEHSMIAGAVNSIERTKTFSRYSLVGAVAGAMGSLGAAAPDYLHRLGVTQATI
jgi:hypothetical protein